MSLQFVIGSSGTGKSCYAYRKTLEEAQKHPGRSYYVIVPEQFTMQTQKNLVEQSPCRGILNIDVLSFERLAFRVFEELGKDDRSLLEDTGKSMVLRKVLQDMAGKMPYLGGQMSRPGYLDEMKSLLSEFMQYEIREDQLEEMKKKAEGNSLLQMKLQDISVLYQAFREALRERYLTSEEVMDALVQMLPRSEKIKGSEILLDGFTGFTPIQIRVIRQLLSMCRKVTVTVTMDGEENLFAAAKPHQLFYMSHKMIRALRELTTDLEEPVILKEHPHSRFAQAPALAFLEKHLFRYHSQTYPEETKEIQMFSAANPREELEETARRIHRLVRLENLSYGEIAVITGNLEEYGNLARQVLTQSEIPFFLDEKHVITMNPFVEYLRSAMEMCLQGFSYVSVFRYLRCGMSDLSRSETDRLENYVLALGIRGFAAWEQKWVRIYRGMRPEEIGEINAIRERFVQEVKGLAKGFGGGKKRLEEYCRILYGHIVSGRIQEKLKLREMEFRRKNDRAMEKEYAQIYGIVMELMDRMAEILGEEMVTAREFSQLLETGFDQAKIALIPPSMDQVLVGDMERTRLKDVRALFFVGVNEGNIPKNTDGGGMLTQLDRDFFLEEGIELAPGPRETMAAQRFYLYLNLTKPSRYLCLSYSRSSNKGESVAPAYLIGNMKSLFPGIVVSESREGKGELEQLELPGTSLDEFLDGLLAAVRGEKTPLFAELYSWYLGNPVYGPVVKRLVQAAFYRNPRDVISKSVARVLYGEISVHSATRLEKYAACAFAHFLQYGLKLTERARYEFQAADMGNIMHQALEAFSVEVSARGLEWKSLRDDIREEMIDECLDKVAADYGNTILKSSARNQYMILRCKRILRRTVWAMQQQLRNGKFVPEGFEVTFGGGRIDRVDVLEEADKVYVKVIDYKTGNQTFQLLSLYYGLQLQLMVYLDSALQMEKRKHPDKEVIPAGVFYYHIQDPMISEKIEADIRTVDEKILKEMKMNGLMQADTELAEKMDSTYMSLPASLKTDGSFRKSASLVNRKQFETLEGFVERKISEMKQSIEEGDVSVQPYELNRKNACTYCPYSSVCGFDTKLPGYHFRRLKNLDERELWKAFSGEEH